MATSIRVVDLAEAGLRPVRPNVPLTLAAGLASSIVLAGMIALIVGRLLSRGAGGRSPV